MRIIKVENYVDVNCTYKSKNHAEFYLKEKVDANLIFFCYNYIKIVGSIHKHVLAGIVKVSQVPLPSPNGYGKALGNKNGNNLTGFFKIKYRGIGIRVVYPLISIWIKGNRKKES